MTPSSRKPRATGPSLPRRIAHCDLDTFFVAVERLRDPSLIGKPVLVGGTGPRSVVATASYEARVFGCHSAQPMSQALRLCPQAIVVSGHFAAYREASAGFHEVLHEVSPLVESAGLDEAYLDLTGIGESADAARRLGVTIREQVRERCGLAVSVGIAGSKTVAKVTSDRAKPDGLIEVPLGGDAAFLAPLPLRELPGLGPKMASALQTAGIRTIGQLADLDPAWLRRRFGVGGEALGLRARGVDQSPLRALPRVPVSVSREVTFGTDVTDLDELRRTLQRHADSVGGDLRRAGRRARTVTLKVRWPDFTTVSRSRTTSRPVQATAELLAAAQELLDEVFASEGTHPVRLIGLGATNLVEDVVQLGFEDAPVQRSERLDHVVDAIRDRFGEGAVRRGRPGRGGEEWERR